MKIIQTGQRLLAILGINPNQSLANVKFFIAMIVYATDVSGQLILFHEANTFFEYANSIFLTSTITMAAVCFIITASIKALVFTAIDLFEKLIEKSE